MRRSRQCIDGIVIVFTCPAQALLHAPVLRSFYLGGGHLRESCRFSSPAEPCLSCELVRLRGRLLQPGQEQPACCSHMMARANQLGATNPPSCGSCLIIPLQVHAASVWVQHGLRRTVMHSNPEHACRGLTVQRDRISDGSISNSFFSP